MDGLVSWEFGFVSSPGPALVRREWMLDVECSDADVGGCVPGSDEMGRSVASRGRGELTGGWRKPSGS